MGHTLRAVIGATFAGTVTFAGLAIAGPASAATAAPTPSASASASSGASTTAICRYYVDADKPIPVKSGPGKKYTTQGWISPDRERPIFGTCATPGTGPSHWVKISQGNHKGGWVWRNWLDRA